MGQIERYRGKQICGMTVYDISMGHEDLPEELKKAGRRFGFPPDASTGDWIRAVVSKDGLNFYLIDLRWTPDNGNECMAFKTNAAGTKMGKAVYCARTSAVDFRNFCLCIGQFGGGLTT
jgi:hypothetical protein